MANQAEQLFHACYQDVYRYLYSLCRDASLAEDLTGEVFLEVVRSAAGYRGECDEKTWLFSIARHRWLHHLRRQRRSPQSELLTELLSEFLESPGAAPEADLLTRELTEHIRALWQQEPDRTREIVRLRLEGLSFYEIGQSCGLSESSARVVFFRFKTKLRQTLEKEGLLP